MEEFAYYKKLEVTSVYGGVSMVNQVKKLAYADIVVATPGRLLDHLKQRQIDLSKVDYLVLDEADRMWDMGFKFDVGKIVTACPRDRQTLLFSATISGDLADFSDKYMKAPVEVLVENVSEAVDSGVVDFEPVSYVEEEVSSGGGTYFTVEFYVAMGLILLFLLVLGYFSWLWLRGPKNKWEK